MRKKIYALIELEYLETKEQIEIIFPELSDGTPIEVYLENGKPLPLKHK